MMSNIDTHLAFNGPLASGLRTLCILNACQGQGLDMESLIALDYLVVNSGDEGGPESLHPPIPQRAGELAVRRSLLESGVDLMEIKGLLKRSFSDAGITYAETDLTEVVLSALESNYTRALLDRAKWAVLNTTQRDGLYIKVIDDALSRWDRQFFNSPYDSQVN